MLITLGELKAVLRLRLCLFLDKDIFLYFTCVDCTLVNIFKIDGEGLDIPEKVAITNKGQVTIVGSTNSTTVPYSNSAGGKDLFVAIWN